MAGDVKDGACRFRTTLFLAIHKAAERSAKLTDRAEATTKIVRQLLAPVTSGVLDLEFACPWRSSFSRFENFRNVEIGPFNLYNLGGLHTEFG